MPAGNNQRSDGRDSLSRHSGKTGSKKGGGIYISPGNNNVVKSAIKDTLKRIELIRTISDIDGLGTIKVRKNLLKTKKGITFDSIK